MARRTWHFRTRPRVRLAHTPAATKVSRVRRYHRQQRVRRHSQHSLLPNCCHCQILCVRQHRLHGRPVLFHYSICRLLEVLRLRLHDVTGDCETEIGQLQAAAVICQTYVTQSPSCRSYVATAPALPPQLPSLTLCLSSPFTCPMVACSLCTHAWLIVAA